MQAALDPDALDQYNLKYFFIYQAFLHLESAVSKSLTATLDKQKRKVQKQANTKKEEFTKTMK